MSKFQCLKALHVIPASNLHCRRSQNGYLRIVDKFSPNWKKAKGEPQTNIMFTPVSVHIQVKVYKSVDKQGNHGVVNVCSKTCTILCMCM